MESMFAGCSSLKSLNLNPLNFDLTTNFDNMFNGCNENFIYCFNEERMIDDDFRNQLIPFENNCLEVCVMQSLKYIPEKIQCIDICSNDDTYQYEYNNICYSSCPTGTNNSPENNFLCYLVCDNYYNYDKTECLNEIPFGYYLNNSELKTIDKCDIKCGICTLESVENDLCISCNIARNYYPKLNDASNKNSFINCYQEQIGYYLDNSENIYKPCYSLCQKCNQLGDNENNKCTECYNNYKLENGNCKILLKEITKKNNFTYFYEMNEETNAIKNKYVDYTYIEISEETKNALLDKFCLDEKKHKIYIIISDFPSNDENTATSDYNYKFILENGTELDLNKINEDLYVDFYVPIRDLDLANYNYSKYFADQGYDIYDKNGNFYNDVCAPAHLTENDITLKDRKIDIYPNNITLCKDNCIYKSTNLEEKRIVCSCNINANNNTNNSDIKEEDDFLKEDDGNFITYFLDKVNYKIFKCYLLISILDNLKQNYAFYAIIGIFLAVIIIDIIFLSYSIRRLKISMIKNIPTNEKLREDIIKELKRIKNLVKFTTTPSPNKKLNKRSQTRITEIETTQGLKTITKGHISRNDNKNNTKRKKTYNSKRKKSYRRKTSPDKDKNNQWNLVSIENLMPANTSIQETNKETIIIEDYNELPYAQAIIYDKRNIFQILKSLIISKIELINIFMGNEKMKVIMVSEYILSLLSNFFFNALLYSDDVVSNKYHNDGQLDFIVTLVLSLLSNVISSIACYFIQYSKGIEDRAQLIMEIKKRRYYLKNIKSFLKFLKLKFILFLICQIIIICGSFYYIVIFFIIYSCSKVSLIMNYLSSLLEGLITSIAISIIILLIRIIGLYCASKNLYNVSKYINNKF